MAENIDNIVRRILQSIRDGAEMNNSDTSNASRPSTSVQPQDLQEELMQDLTFRKVCHSHQLCPRSPPHQQ